MGCPCSWPASSRLPDWLALLQGLCAAGTRRRTYACSATHGIEDVAAQQAEPCGIAAHPKQASAVLAAAPRERVTVDVEPGRCPAHVAAAPHAADERRAAEVLAQVLRPLREHQRLIGGLSCAATDTAL